MKKCFTGLVILLTLAAGTAAAQQAVRFAPERPIEGDTVTISYNPETTVLKGLAPVSGVVYLYRNNDWETHDLQVQMTDSGWLARYLLPEHTVLITLNFSANGITDKGGRLTYTSLVSDRQGKQLPTSYAAWGFLRTPELADVVPPAVDTTAYITDQVALFWMNNELRYYPQSRRHIFYNTLSILKHSGAARADSIIIREINFISSLEDVTEKELMDISNAYRTLLGNHAKADSMDNIIIQRYPNGITARDKMIYRMFRASQDTRYALYKEFIKQFPPEKFRDVNTETNRLFYEKTFRSVVYSEYVRTKSLQILDEMMDQAPLVSLTEFHRLMIMGALEHDQVKLETAFPYSRKLVTHIEAYTHKKYGPESRFYSPLQWKDYVLRIAAPAFMGHASLLHQKGDDKAALVWMEKIKTQPLSQTADFMSLYTTLLENLGRHEEALEVAKNSARTNKATPETIALLKKDYVRQHKNDSGFETYFQGMKNAGQLSEEQEKLRASLIHKDAPAFRLEQLSGGIADLSKMKGRIVVLDFWATWCGPCKAALPGMQMAVDKYSKDKGVQFYFIATQESRPDYREQIKKFMQSKNYHLDVLLDAKNKTSGKLDDTYEQYTKVMGFSGIPAKIIIDGKGVIRWMASGYKGSPSALADEISYVIDLLKQEQ